jgi:hypothetical protein
VFREYNTVRRYGMLISLGSGIVLSALLSGSFPMLDDTLDLSVGQYRYVSFCVDIAQAESTHVAGMLQVEPDTLALELMLFHIDDFNRWAAGLENVDTLFYARRSSGSLDIPIQGFGNMVLVISNRGNTSPATLAASLELVFAGTGVPYNALDTASKIVLVMMAGAAVTIMIAGAFITLKKQGLKRR